MNMKAKEDTLLSALHVLSLGFFCGMVSIPLVSVLFSSLIRYYRRKRETPVTLYPQMKTERGMVIRVVPRSFGEKERESTRLLVKAR